jgi:CRP-like cAMP-binding protein
MTSLDPSIGEELRTLRFCAEWPAAVLAEVAAISRVVTFPANSVIFREGQENHDVYVISKGQVGLDMSVPARGSVRILTLSNGELLAWSALLGKQMTATAIAVGETRALAIPADRLLAICDANHEIGYVVMRRLAWALSRRLVATRLQMLDLFAQTTPHIFEPTVRNP